MRTLPAMALAAILALTGAPFAHAAGHGAIHVDKAWIRVLPGMLPNAGYAVLRNDGAHGVKLVAADSPAYSRVMLHRSVMKNGVDHMIAIPSLEIPAHGKAVLAPGGYHLMLMRRKQPIKPGDRIIIRLHFADGSTIKADFLARPANATGFSG